MKSLQLFVTALCLLSLSLTTVQASDPRPVTFYDASDSIGIGYRHDYRGSPLYAEVEALKALPYITDETEADAPYKTWGAPGVAIWDYDGDGDLDLYVPNGVGVNNSLYANQLTQTGMLAFVDMAESAGVAARDYEGTGVCYGDTDNDGDPDLIVLGKGTETRFFANRGDGTFTDQSDQSGLSMGEYQAVSCALGDINGDGLLDVVIANAFDLSSRRPLMSPYKYNHPNQLFLNLGDNRFKDISAESGILKNTGLPDGAASISWAVAMVDYDLDGDQDIFFADDQAGVPLKGGVFGIDRGFIQVFQNDGRRHFTNLTEALKLPVGDWMGLAFGDLNCDDRLDVFATNFGDYFKPLETDRVATRWFLGGEDGTFIDSRAWKQLGPTAFGWGTSIFDYDNDSDPDITFYGNYEGYTALILSNPGILLRNESCSAKFAYDLTALAGSRSHIRRIVQGVAVGDLNNDGFGDIVSVSSIDIPAGIQIQPGARRAGTPLNTVAGTVSLIKRKVGIRYQFTPTLDALEPGTLSVELNSADNGNGWLSVELIGAAGLLPEGKVNRSAIGAVVRFTPQGMPPTTRPILGGSSYASQDSLIQGFGMGNAKSGTLDILWPGGTRNRLYDVRAGERLRIPEIPCSIDNKVLNASGYRACVSAALDSLQRIGVIDAILSARLSKSAIRAYSALR